MYYQSHGSGPPVVLVHGLGAYSFSWRYTVAALEHSYTTYAIDLLGFGQSPAPAGFPNTMSAQADAVSGFIKTQNLVDPIVIGHSMGGGVSLRVAEHAGKNGQPKLSKLVLIAPVAYPPSKPLLGLDVATLSELPISQQFSRGLAGQILSRAYVDPSRITSEQIEGYAKGLSSRAQFQAFLDHSSKLGDVAVPEADLGAITVKTLIIYGEGDTFVPPSDGEKLKNKMPMASSEIIKDCGHIPHEEQPLETNNRIKAFCDA